MRYDYSEYSNYCDRIVADVEKAVEEEDIGYLRSCDHWETFTEQFIESIQDKHCFLDVGAGLGFYSFLAKKHNPNISIIAIEADPARAHALMKHLDATVFNIALYSDFGVVNVDKPHISSSSVIKEHGGAPVVSLPLDMMLCYPLMQEVDIMKVDIEGAELEMFRGAGDFIDINHPEIYLEVHKSQSVPMLKGTVSDLEYLLKQYGYSEELVDDRHVLLPDLGY